MAVYLPLTKPYAGALPYLIDYDTAYRFSPSGGWEVGFRGTIEFLVEPVDPFAMWFGGTVVLKNFVSFDTVGTIVTEEGNARRYSFDLRLAADDLSFIQFYATSSSFGSANITDVIYRDALSGFWTLFKGQKELP